MKYEVLVNRYGNVLVYKRKDSVLTFVSYARTIEGAVTFCANHPTTIVVQGR